MKTTRSSAVSIDLGEWRTRHVSGVSLSGQDRQLLKTLDRPGRPRLRIRELRDGVEVQAFSWVGVARLSGLDVQVVPKLVGGALNLVRMIEFTSGVDVLRKSVGIQSLGREGSELLDLVALLLVEECERLVAGGLITDYVEREELLGVVRGRLLADRQVLERFGQVDLIYCRFDEREQDVPENQLLLAALAAARRVVRSQQILRRIRRTEGVFRAVCSFPEVRAGELRGRIQYDRLNEHYRNAHMLAAMLLEALGFDELFEVGPISCFAFMLNMNRLFEEFAYEIVRRAVTGLAYVASFHRGRRGRPIIWNLNTGKPYRRVWPDILLMSPDRAAVIPIDAKYKLYSTKRISPADTYQALVYSYAYGPAASNGRVAVIMYPSSTNDVEVLTLKVRKRSGLLPAELRAVGVPIARLLKELYEPGGARLLETLRSVLVSGATAGEAVR